MCLIRIFRKGYTMKKMILIAVAILILGLAVPVSARGHEYVGERLNLRNGNQKYPAGVPFHIIHGWIHTSPDGPQGQYDFELEIDGVPVKEDFVDLRADPSGDAVDQYWGWVYNFPDGMTGTHYFTLHYFGPCMSLYGPEYCPVPDRNDVIEDWAFTVKVKFVP